MGILVGQGASVTTMLQWLSRLFRSQRSPGYQTQASKRPAWASKVPVSSQPIQLCSPLSAVAMLPISLQQPQAAAGRPATTSAVAEGALRPVAGTDNAVPWPFPTPAAPQPF